MKRRYAMMRAALCLLLLAAGTAQAQVELRLVCAERVLRTDPVQVTLEAVVPEGTMLGAVQATLDWDPGLLGLVRVEDGAFGGLSVKEEEGILKVAAFNAAGRSGTFTVAELTFHDAQAIGGEAEIFLALDELSAAGDFADLLPTATAVSCAVSLAAEAAPLVALALSGPDEILAGDRLVLELTASLVEGVRLGAVDATLSWDPKMLALVGTEGGGFAPLLGRPGDVRTGQWSFSAFNAEGMAGQAGLARLIFQTRVDTAGAAAVGLTVSELTGISTFADLLPHAQTTSYTTTLVRDPAARPLLQFGLDAPESVEPEELIEVDVTMVVPEGVALGAIDFRLDWNPDHLTFVEFKQGGYAPFTVSAKDGELAASAFDPVGHSGVLLLGQVVFRAGAQGVDATAIDLFVRELTAAETFADFTNWAEVSGAELAILVPLAPLPPVTATLTSVSEVTAGELVEAVVQLELPDGVALGAAGFTMTWTPAHLTFIEVKQGNFAALNVSAEDGSLMANGIDAAGKSGTVELGRVVFRANDNAVRSTTVRLTIGELAAAGSFRELQVERQPLPVRFGIVLPDLPPVEPPPVVIEPDPPVVVEPLVPLRLAIGDLVGIHGPYMAMNGRERLFITFQNGRSAQIPERAAQGRANNICKLNGRAEATDWLAMPSLSRTEPTLTMVTDTGNLVRNTRGQLEVNSRGRQIGPTKFFSITCGTEPFSAGKRVAQRAAQEFELTPAYPNPFNSEVVIRFSLPQGVSASVEIYNMAGQRVRVLESGFLAGGSHRLVWDGLDNGHHRVATGMYLVRLNAGVYRSVQKITLLR